MFQNIPDDGIIDTKEETRSKKNILANAFSKKYILLYIITFMVSMIGMGQQISPFSLAIVAAIVANEIPVVMVLIFALIGNIVGCGYNSIVTYIVTILIFFASFLVFQPKYNEEGRNEKIKLVKRIFYSTLIVQVVKIVCTNFMLYDVFVAISMAIIVAVFYKIFVNSITVLTGFNRIKAFSIEEVIGGSLLLSIAVCAFGDISIIGFSIRNILSIFIVLVLGWKNGILIGTTSGVSIGITLGIIAGNDPMVIAAYAISGMIAGVLSKLGKIGVIVGFILGDVILVFASNGGVQNLILFKEILIAGLALLAVPQNINLNIENIIGDNKFLPTNITRGLDRSRETINKLEEVSDTVNDMANEFEKVATTTVDEVDIRQKNKQIFISELLNHLDNMKDNLLYEPMSDVEGKIVGEIFETLQEKQIIRENDLLGIFAKNNNYIVGFDKQENSVHNDITRVIEAINSSYKVSKMNFILDKKIKKEKENTSNQLKGVSKVISELAEDIKVEIKNEEKYYEEKEQIISLLKQRDLTVWGLTITRKKGDRFIGEIYIKENDVLDEEEMTKKVLSKVLNEKIIINNRKYIEEEEYTRYNFISDDLYELKVGYATKIKDNNSVSGDSLLKQRLRDGKYLIAISDGMGNGTSARRSSQIVIKMLSRLLNSGFDKETSIDLINTNLLNVGEDVFATIDIAIVDLYKGNIEFIKNGACPTYIKNKKRVQIVKSLSLPAGIIGNSGKDVFDMDINGGEYMVMCSDGILDSNIEYKNKELWIKYLLEDIEDNIPQKIADIIINEAIDNTVGKIKDDMSIIVCSFEKK